MKKRCPEKHLYKLRSGINWVKGKGGLDYLRARKNRHKGPECGGSAGENEGKLCVWSNMSKSESGEIIIHSFK